jgi:hypothetical protein
LIAALHDEICICKEQGYFVPGLQRRKQALGQSLAVGPGHRESGDGYGVFYDYFLHQHEPLSEFCWRRGESARTTALQWTRQRRKGWLRL